MCNFTARIIEDELRDDGAEHVRQFVIEAAIAGRRARQFTVPAARFAGMTWPIEELGASATVEPGFGLRDRARVAIQRLSGDVPTRTLYAHTGWRLLDGQWLYLHAGGAIGSVGAVEGIETALRGTLTRFVLPLRRSVQPNSRPCARASRCPKPRQPARSTMP